MSRQQSGQPRPDHHAYRAGRAESGQRRGASLRLDVIGHQCRRAGRHRGVETAGEAAQENNTGEGEQGRQRPVQGEHDEQAERAVGKGEAGQPAEQYPPSPMPVAGDAPGRAASIQAMPPTVTAAPACQGARPSLRASGPTRATKDITARVQTKVSNISGRRSGCWRRTAGWSSQGFLRGRGRRSQTQPTSTSGVPRASQESRS